MASTIRVGDLDFTVREAGPGSPADPDAVGAGLPVLALHGFPATSLSWALVAADLVEQGRRVITVDQRGYSPGARPAGVEAYSLDHLVDDVVGLLDALDLPQVDLVGHDWGAIVAWTVAARHPERVSSLTALSVPHPVAFDAAIAGDAEQRDASSYIGVFRREGYAEEALLADDARALRAVFGAEVPDQLVDAYVEQLSAPGALTAALNWYRADLGLLASVPDVTVPTTFVWGARDPAIRSAGARACGEHVSGDYRFVELAEHGHWLPEAASEQVAAEVLRHASD